MKKVNYLLALVALVAVFTTCEKNENSVVLGDKEKPYAYLLFRIG